jgi:hypothetical protein
MLLRLAVFLLVLIVAVAAGRDLYQVNKTNLPLLLFPLPRISDPGTRCCARSWVCRVMQTTLLSSVRSENSV